MSHAGVSCPRCPAGPFTEAGRLAGHLVELHGQSAAVALHDARKLLAPEPPVTPAERDQIAKRLGVKSTHPIVKDVLQRAGVPVQEPDSKEANVAKRSRKCSKCQKPGHRANKCTETTRSAPAAAPTVGRRKDGVPRGSLREIAGAANGAGSESAVTSAKAAVQTLLHDALAEAKAYVAELERLVASA